MRKESRVKEIGEEIEVEGDEGRIEIKVKKMRWNDGKSEEKGIWEILVNKLERVDEVEIRIRNFREMIVEEEWMKIESMERDLINEMKENNNNEGKKEEKDIEKSKKKNGWVIGWKLRCIVRKEKSGERKEGRREKSIEKVSIKIKRKVLKVMGEWGGIGIRLDILKKEMDIR